MIETEPNKREYKGFTFNRLDPYGFWVIQNGPKELTSNRFTTTDLARKAIDVYLDNQEKKASKVDKKRV